MICSLGLGKKNHQLNEEITSALAELGMVVDEEGRRRIMYGSGTPSRRQRGEALRHPPSPLTVNVHTTVTTRSDAAVPSAAPLEFPARPLPTADTLPIAQQYSRVPTIDQLDRRFHTPSPTDTDFVIPHVEATPPVIAVPQRVAVAAPLQFHRPIQSQRITLEDDIPPTPVYRTIDNELTKQIEVESNNAVPLTKRTRSPTISTTSGASISSHRSAQPLAWPPPPAATSARVAGLAVTSLASAGSASSSLPNSNNHPNRDLENIGSSSLVPAPQPGTAASLRQIRPLSLLQGRLDSTGPAGTGKPSTTTPMGSSYVTSRSAGKTSKGTTSSGKGSTGAQPLGPTPKSNRSVGRHGRQDENQTVGSAVNNAQKGSTPKSGLKPLRLARSATSKARGQEDTAPDVVVRPPSVVYSFNQHDVMA